MTGQLVTFVPQAELTAEANLAGFIDVCRNQLTIFGDIDFGLNEWEVTDTINHKGKKQAVRLVFTNLETSTSKNKRVLMQEPFLSFAKAYIRYQHGMAPTLNVSGRLVSLRALESALLETGSANPVRMDAHVFNRAATLLSERLAADTAYRTGGQLEMIADFLKFNRLTIIPLDWHNPIKRPQNGLGRVGKQFDDRRAQKMPTDAALSAIPKIFSWATEPSDMLVTSVCAILLSAPDRINELLQVPENCEVRLVNPETGKEAYGLRWWPAKGAQPMIKWIIPSMDSVVTEAISRIRKLTSEARRVAAWYEQNSEMAYLPPELEYLRTQEWLSVKEVGEILYAEPVKNTTVRTWCESNNVPFNKEQREFKVRFVDLQSAILSQLPPGFPYLNRTTGFRYSDSLFVSFRNQFDLGRTAFQCILEPITQGFVFNRLGSRQDNQKSIFDRAGLTEPDGSSIQLTTHQFRHYLNTLAQTGGMSQLDIAKWSGRKDIRQNQAYDHETSESLLARVREVIGDSERLYGPISTAPRAQLIPRDEFARLKVPTAHTTDYGYCIHDYVMSPCQMHADCLNCNEQICVKGESEKESRIRQAHQEATRLLEMAEAAEADGEFGASEWVKHHRNQLDRVSSLLEILDNPAVPSGSIIQLRPTKTPSRIEQATEQRLGFDRPMLSIGMDVD